MSRTLGRLRPPRARRHGGADGGKRETDAEVPAGSHVRARADPTPIEEWSEAEVTAHLDYYRRLNQALVDSGELVDTTILVGPDRTKVVRGDGVGAPLVTDGPFPEFKEWLAGFQVVEVADEARALEIAALVSAVPGKDGVPTQQPIHVRQVMDDGPADAAEMDDYLSSAQGS